MQNVARRGRHLVLLVSLKNVIQKAARRRRHPVLLVAHHTVVRNARIRGKLPQRRNRVLRVRGGIRGRRGRGIHLVQVRRTMKSLLFFQVFSNINILQVQTQRVNPLGKSPAKNQRR
jgi:hypothetical protein